MASTQAPGQAPGQRGPDEYQFLTPSRPPEPVPGEPRVDLSRAGEEIEIDDDDERILDEVWAEMGQKEAAS